MRARLFRLHCPSMNFYLYRDNYVVKVGEGDGKLENKLRSQGYELFDHPLPTKDEAESVQHLWQTEIDQRRSLGLF